MKTSNILLTIFASAIALYLLAAFTEVRLRGTPKNEMKLNRNSVSEEMPAFRYLVVEGDDQRIILAKGDKPVLEKSWIGEEDNGAMPSHQLKGDTLVLKMEGAGLKSANYILKLPSYSLKGIEGNGAKISLDDDFEAQNFSMNLNKSQIWVHGEGVTGKMVVIGTDARVELYRATLDTLDMDLSKSRLECHKRTDVVMGAVRDDSRLALGGAGKLLFELDPSSRFEYWNR